jgi:hypothetical protein
MAQIPLNTRFIGSAGAPSVITAGTGDLIAFITYIEVNTI